MRALFFSISLGFVGLLSASACSSFNGTSSDVDGSSSSDDGGTETGPIMGESPDEAFTVAAPTTRSFLVQGQMQTVRFTVKRGAVVKGPITFAFNDLPAGVTATNTSLVADETKLDVQFTATAEAAQKLAQVTVTATTTETAAGKLLSASSKFELFLRGPSGAPDTTFGTNGQLVVDALAGGDDFGPLLLVGPGDQIYARKMLSCASASCLRRYTADGAVDATFGTNGEVSVPYPAAAVIQPDNRFVGVGHGTTRATLAYRLNPDGSADPNFGDGSEGTGTISVQSNYGTVGGGNAVGLGTDGSFAVTFPGTAPGAPARPYVGVARFDSKGALIPAFQSLFGAAGISIWSANDLATQIPTVEVKKNGHVTLAAVNGVTVGTSYDATELDAQGATYLPFGSSGSLHTLYPNANDIQEYTGSVTYADGSLVFPVVKTLVKINAVGQWDPTFGTSGAADLASHAYAIAGTPDGKIVVFTSAVGGPSVTRVDGLGAVDTSFGTNGIATIDVKITQRGRIAVQSDGRILVMGAQTIARMWN